MLLSHAPPPPFLTTWLHYHHHLHRHRTFSLLATTLSLSVTKHFSSHSRRFSLLPMKGVTLSAGDYSSPEHVSFEWYSVPELRLRDHHFTVPLDYSRGPHSSPTISVFAREVVAVGKEEQTLPYLLFLQGGPGYECRRPTESSGWIQKVCKEFRLILMDQRGTGLSTPLTVSSMSQFKSAAELADFLKHFRADSIVNDAEFIRVRLVPDAGPWTILGQSFGGFCAVTYLSFAPQGLKQVLITGGIPLIGGGCTADSVYRACFEQIIHQNEKYYKRFPQDIKIVQELVNYLAEQEGGRIALPSGGILTPRGLQTLGLSGLGSGAGFESLHYMFERVWDPTLVPGAPKRISYYFLNSFEKWLTMDTNPLYALLHESIYCQGSASRWSANRIRTELPVGLEVELDELEEPEAVLASREILEGEQLIKQWLVKWKGRAPEDTTWEDESLLTSQFPNFSLEDKAATAGGGSDRTPGPELVADKAQKKPIVWRVYSRKKKVGPRREKES